ncbi:hypothetical protein Bbelb_279600 [Branchiostoma belcheri]|nr:hypothetical protein Bbelb_279600 [Branchiostoma belcheri]
MMQTSYDVCSLFTSIPPKEAVSVVREALEADDTLADRTNLSVDQVCELLELCLGCTYFTYKGQFYQQMHGCAMGSPVSPIVVNLYMEKFENKALSTFNDTPPANWFRYVDDTWCRLKKRVAADFFDHINQIDDNIKFTQEPSHDNMLPFLDTKTIVEEYGNLRFEVYRKPTHTDQYLAFDSHHPLEHKLAVIKTLFHRADNIVTSDQAKTDEQKHLRGALAKCGYQNWTFNKALKPSDQSKKTQKCKPLTNKNKANITIPYFQGVSEKLRRIFQNFNIATNFKPHSTLRQRLVHPKDRPHKGTKANVIYRLKCEEPNSNNTYIGETSRPLKVRYKEHCRSSANGYSSFSTTYNTTNFNFDIIGLCEARRKGEGCLVLARSKHHLYFKGGDTHHRGVGFLVNKNIAGNVTAFKGISDRVAKLSIKINSRYSLDIIQAYLPTSNSTDEEVEAVYEDIDNLINNSRAHYKIIMGDFNAKVGMGDSSSSSTGPFGYGTRNSRGDTLVNFAERHKMRIMNTHFKKPPNRRWTWISPGGAYKNEIDYILTNKPQNFTDVSVINKFNTGSDHRMVRGSMTINTKLERAKLTKPRKPDEIKLKANTAQFQLQLSNRFEALTTSEDIDIECSNITSIIMETALKTGGQKKCNRPNKLSEETKQLRGKRRQMKRDGTNAQNREYTEICKTIRKKMAEEITAYNEKKQQEALKASRCLKSVKRRQVLGRSKMTTLKEEDGTVIHDLDRMVKRCEEFYTNLYSTRQNTDRASTSTPRNNRTGEQNTERLPPILPSDVRAAIERLKLNKAPGDDNITAGILKCGGEPLVTKFTQIFNKCLSEGKVPSAWKNASIVLIHKKGDTNDIKNYRPISLLSVIYKIFSQILLWRMMKTLDQHLTREQAGFRPKFSTVDHLQVVAQLQEKANEYNIPLCFAFVNYEKAFDSFEFEPMFAALEHQGVDSEIITLLKDLYDGATSTLRLHKESEKIKLERGARQGDNISAKLFTACLQDAVVNKINWDKRGINIDGEYLSHLLFADDIILVATSPQELEEMLQDIHNASKPVGLNMHLGKTKLMFNKHADKAPVLVNGVEIEVVDSYIYLGKKITHDGSILPEIKRRITLG